MTRMQIESAWHGTGVSAEDAIRPRVATDYTLKAWSDRSGKSGPDLLLSGGVIQAHCDNAVAVAMEADPKYAGKISDKQVLD
jgi:hypothetical protein